MSVDKYRRHAVDCLRIAEGVPSPQSRMILIDMAQSWLLLAQQAETSAATDRVHERPEVHRPGVVAQQQQQIQPKKKDE
jgi:hypothetical protein